VTSSAGFIKKFIKKVHQEKFMEENKFRTKTGYCHILEDRILLTRDSIVGNISEIAVGNNISRILIIYAIISIFLFYFAFEYYREEKSASMVFNVILGLFLVYSIKKSWNNSAASIIQRESIKEVKFMNAKYGATRSVFEIIFEDLDGKLKKRLILLPGSLNNGPEETEKALAIMKNNKLIA
jgi:hypothetical protein